MRPKNDEFVRRDKVIQEIEAWFKIIGCNPDILIDNINSIDGAIPYRHIDELISDIEDLRVTTRTNWDGCCPDPDYPEIESVDISKQKLIELVKKHLCKEDEPRANIKKVEDDVIIHTEPLNTKVDPETAKLKHLSQPCLSTEDNDIMVDY